MPVLQSSPLIPPTGPKSGERSGVNIITRNTNKCSNRLTMKRARWNDRFLHKLISEIA